MKEYAHYNRIKATNKLSRTMLTSVLPIVSWLDQRSSLFWQRRIRLGRGSQNRWGETLVQYHDG